VLSGLKTLKICTGYRFQGKILNEFPARLEVLKECQPIYHEMAGWTEELTGMKSLSELPKAALEYVRFVERSLHLPMTGVSVGPSRDENIFIQNPFN
ncbi:MAG: adenylosuccinate synthetase, partial [bacterium]|nr:adenylosuccinate synthetase [bacterium]